MEDDDNFNENKVIFLGDTNVGKTSLIRISTGRKIDSGMKPTVTASFTSKRFSYNKKDYVFNLWDTIGQEKYRALVRIFFKNAIILVLVYDITNKNSFNTLNYWHEQIKNELMNDSYILAVVGNKKDLYQNEEISEEEAQKFADGINAKFTISSAKEEPLVFIEFLEELFIDYIKKIYNKKPNLPRNLSLKKKDIIKKNKKKCC